MIYDITWKKSALKDINKLDNRNKIRILKEIRSLGSEPLPNHRVKLKASNLMYRIRIGEYRVIYTIVNKQNRIVIFYIRHRSTVYRNF